MLHIERVRVPRVALVLLALVVVASVAACTTLRVGSDYDRSAAFSGYHRFAWLSPEPVAGGNPLITQRARDAVQSSFAAKGYTYVDNAADADFVVNVTIGAHDRIDIRTYPTPYAGPWYWDRPGWWGYPYWGSGVDVSEYREGTLSVDVFDARTHRAVWHGWAKKVLSRSDIEHSAAPIREATDAVLSKFPPA